MSITDLLLENYILIILLTGMFIITLFFFFLYRSMILKLRVVLVLILALSICNDLETYTRNLEHFTYWRLIFSVICYSLRPTIIMMLIYIVSPKTSKLMIIPAVINFLVSASAFFTDISFTFDMESNHFIRGPLGYTPYVMTVIYILTLYYITVRTLTGRFSEEGIVIFFITLAATISTVLAFYGHDEVVNLTFASEVMLYYMYLYAQYTKRDPLTSVFNRQTMDSDLKRRTKNITGIISIDMNDLKWLNDNIGHEAGDKGLKTITNCLRSAATKKERIYRTGGDEFIIICRNFSEDEIKNYIDKTRTAVSDAGYSCAFGYSVGKSIDVMMKESDELMYKDKARIKSELKAKGIVHERNSI